MPEQPPDPREALGERIGEEGIGALVTDDEQHGLAPDEATIHGIAVEAGPEVDRLARRRARGLGIGIGAWLAIIWLVLLIVLAATAPLLPLDDPVNDATPAQRLEGPSVDHPMGLDGSGRDVMSRVIWGARNSLFIGAVSVGAGLLIGGFLGLVAGYFKGRIGGLIGGALDVLLAFPQLVLALAIVSIPVLARIARASTLSWSEREFVLASRAQGAKHARVMRREVLPNILPAMFSIALLGIAVVIVAEGGLAIIGAGVNPEVVTWGNVIVTGQSDLQEAPHIVMSVSIVVFFTVLSLNFLGDVVRARFDVRESSL